MGRFTGVLGLLVMLGGAYLFSTNRQAIRLKIVAWGLGLQIALAFLIIRGTGGQILFMRAGNAVNHGITCHFLPIRLLTTRFLSDKLLYIIKYMIRASTKAFLRSCPAMPPLVAALSVV